MRNWLLSLICVVLVLGTTTAHAQDLAPPSEELELPDYLIPAGLTLFSNGVFWGAGRFVLDKDYSRISGSSVKRNFTEGFEWDVDGFATNQFGHPYQGGLYFASARAQGIGFWTSGLYAFGGSLQWEMFMETELPSYNDVVTTTFGGIALGETLFRLSETFIDPSTSGAERVAREIIAGVISPTAGLSRVISGEITESGPKPQAPNIGLTLMAGPDRLSQDTLELSFSSLRFELNMVYQDVETGDFEPFDWFVLSGSLNTNNQRVQRAEIDVMGILARKTFDCAGGFCFVGINQHFGFRDTPLFSTGASSLGGSVVTRFPIGENFSILAHLHLNYVALGGLNALNPEPETNPYSIGVGAMSRAGASFRFQSARKYWFQDFELTLQDTRYFLRTLRGEAGSDFAGVSTARLRSNIFGGFGLVLGGDTYDRWTWLDSGKDDHDTAITEQIFVVWSMQN